jgi:hypothetical protein
LAKPAEAPLSVMSDQLVRPLTMSAHSIAEIQTECYLRFRDASLAGPQV